MKERENWIACGEQPIRGTVEEPERFDELLIRLIEKRDRQHAYWLRKRAFDIVVSFSALVALLPAFVIIALIVWIDDPHCWPFFFQTRCVKGGRPFRMVKFRTMVADAEAQFSTVSVLNEADGPVFKMRNDPRVTRVGRFLRKTSLDELPQLLNVLKGDLSIVGPRPPLPQEVERYQQNQRRRLLIEQGLTCYWQVSPMRNETSFDDWLALDLAYIRDRSFRVDLAIIAGTFRVMLKGEGV